MTDSCSLTPPISPGSTDEKSASRLIELSSFKEIPCFSCRTSILCGVFNSHGDYLKNGYFNKLLHKEIFFDNLSTTLLLFNKPYNVNTSLWLDSKSLFTFAKKQLGILRSLVQPKVHLQFNNEEVFQIRMQLCNFFAFIKDFLLKLNLKVNNERERYLSTSSMQLKHFLNNFIAELKGLLFFNGPLSSIPDVVLNNVISHNSVNSSSYYQYFHVCLDLWWSAFEILYIVCELCDSACLNRDDDSLYALKSEFKAYFHKIINNIIFDLCSLAANYFKISYALCDSSVPFVCSCNKQIWIQIILLLDKCNETRNDAKFFWSYLFEVVREIFQNNGRSHDMFHNKIIEISNIAHLGEFFLWLLCHIAPLYNYDLYGNLNTSTKPISFYPIPKYIVECIFNDELAKNESNLRKMLVYLFLLVKEWEPKGDILLLLTDFYVKKIDDTFSKSKLEIQGFSYIFKTTNCWLNLIKSISLENNRPQITENSFHVYLRILSIQLNQSGLDSSLWRQIKGRICSKFTPKRLKELSEVGLQNCFSIFLCAAFTANLEEVSLKVCEFAMLMQSIPLNNKKQIVALKALFVLLFIHQEQNKNLSKVASKAVQLFNNYCSKYLSIKEPTIRNEIMNLILLYVDNMNDIFGNSQHLNLSEDILIGFGFSTLLPICTNEMNYFLTIFLNILLKMCDLVKTGINELHESHFNVLKSLYDNIFPFIKNHVLTNTPPHQLADVAVAFTYLSIRFVQSLPKITSYTSIDLFKYFANAPEVQSTISARYLNFLVNDSYIIENLKCSMDDFSTVLIQAWLKCCITLIPPCEQTEELTKYIFSMREIKTTFSCVTDITYFAGMHDFLSIRLFKIMSESYQNCSSLKERNIMKEKTQLYFCNTSSLISSYMKHTTSVTYFMHLYKLMGHLVEYCALLLHAKHSQNNILPKLIDILLFPHIMFPKENFLTATLSRPIKENLSLFITGLLKLDYKNEPYVKRILKSIVIHYLDNFSLKNNPVLFICISSATQNVSSLDCNAFNFLCSLLKDHILSNFNSYSSNGFKFLSEIVRNIPSIRKKEVCEMFIKDLLTLFLRFDGVILNSTKHFLNTLFNFLRKETDVFYQKQFFIPLCENFITEKLAWAQSKVFRILEYLSEYFGDVITELIPSIIKHIEYVESQRGSGIDIALRKELKILTEKLHGFESNSFIVNI